MAWQTPSIQTLVTETVRAINANMPGADAALARNNLRPMAKVTAGGLFDLHRKMDWTARQRFVLTCDADQLDRHGAEMKPAVPRKEAAAASGRVAILAATPLTLATGTLLTRSDGAAFRATAGIVLGAGGEGEIVVSAVLPGAAGATEGDTVLTAGAGLTGSGTFTVTAAGLGGAADRESDAAYRSRLLFAKAYPEHGGAAPDWYRYALACAGVTRAFVDPLGQGRGTVVIYPFFDLTRPNGIGLESDRLAVRAQLRAIGAGAALPVVRLPQPVPIAATFEDLAPPTPEVRQAVAAEVATAFRRNSRVCGHSEPHPSMPFLAVPETFSRSWLWQAAANATGEQRHILIAPTGDTVLAPGEVAVPGPLTFV